MLGRWIYHGKDATKQTTNKKYPTIAFILHHSVLQNPCYKDDAYKEKSQSHWLSLVISGLLNSLSYREKWKNPTDWIWRRMAMAITKKLLPNAILLFCVALASCDKRSSIRPGRRRYSNEKIFNVVQFGAKTDPEKDNALVRERLHSVTCPMHSVIQ